MKKIIRGKRYDTDTARSVGEWENMIDVRDFAHCTETLYCKRNGEYFLHCVGGPMSRYATPQGDNTWSGGARIMPLTYNSAREWAEIKLDADEYEAEFGEVSEGDEDESVTLSVRVSPAARAALDRAASVTGRSKGDIVSELLLGLR